MVQWAANSATEYLSTILKPGVPYDELEIAEMLDEARYKFRRISKKAQDIGTMAHQWVEDELHGRKPAFPVNEQARKSCLAASEWITQHKFKPTVMEHRIYSRKYKIAGTMDCLGEVDGELSVVDWKTSTGIYPEYHFQTAFYTQAYKEMNSYTGPISRWVVRLDKKTGDVEARKLPASALASDLAVVVASKRIYERLADFK